MTLARADLILGYGRHIIDAIKPFIAQDKDIVTWIRGIPLAPRAAYRKINPENQLRIATTRKLWRWYRHDLIIRAVSQLKKSGINARIDIYGDGEAKGELGLIATKLGVADACVFHDYVSSERIARALPESELYVSTVPSDGASASLMEAFYLGLFPIVPDIPGNRYFADKGMYIGLYHPGDLDSLYSAIMSYWRHRDEHQWMIDSNYQRILELGDINKNIKILLNLYNDKFTEKRNLALKSPSGSTGMLHSDQKKRSRME
jgi:glycosyltransferase involved in cell wall biosynthesis